MSLKVQTRPQPYNITWVDKADHLLVYYPKLIAYRGFYFLPITIAIDVTLPMTFAHISQVWPWLYDFGVEFWEGENFVDQSQPRVALKRQTKGSLVYNTGKRHLRLMRMMPQVHFHYPQKTKPVCLMISCIAFHENFTMKCIQKNANSYNNTIWVQL